MTAKQYGLTFYYLDKSEKDMLLRASKICSLSLSSFCRCAAVKEARFILSQKISEAKPLSNDAQQ